MKNKSDSNYPHAKKTYQFSLDGTLLETFTSVREAGEKLGLSVHNISSCANGHIKTCGGYIFSYTKKIDLSKRKASYPTKPILQYSLGGTFTAEYCSIVEASQKLDVSYSSIIACLTGKSQTAGGYVFRYKYESDYPKNKPRPDMALYKTVYQYSLEGELLDEFISVIEAARLLSIPAYLISRCARGDSKTAKGYIFSYNKNFIPPVINQSGQPSKVVYQFSPDGKLLNKYKSVSEASRILNIARPGIYNCAIGKIDQYAGYVFRYTANFKLHKPKNTTVYQFSPDGSFIKKYTSIKSAAQEIGITPSAISKAVRLNQNTGRSYTAGGFVWSNSSKYNVNIPAPKLPKKERIRICPICGKTVLRSPSDKQVTCGDKDCWRKYVSQNRTGIQLKWGDDAKKKLSQKGQTPNLKLGTAAAKESPLSGRFETNINAKFWRVRSPWGEEYEFRNLLNWCRENCELFDKEPSDKSAVTISSGFKQIKRSKEGKRKQVVTTYKGWELIDWT